MKLLKRTEETFVLPKDVENPSADRRFKRDWTKTPVWEKGTKFVVTTELIERSDVLERKSVLERLVAHLIADGKEIPQDVQDEYRAMQLLDLSPREIKYVQKRGTYQRLNAGWEEAAPLMEALQPAKKDLKDVLGDYADDSWGGPIVVLKQLVKNGTLSLKDIELAVAQLDPDHTPLDSIVMATASDELSEDS